MKTRPEQLGQQLKRASQPLPIYLVTGDEPLISDESCDRIRQYLRDNAFSEREVMHVENGFIWENIFESANALSLFADRKLIELRLGKQKLPKPASQLLQSYLSNPSPDTVLLLIADRLDKSAKQSAWYKSIEQHGLVVEIWPVESDQLGGWIQQRAAQLGVTLTPDALQLLSDRVEGNLLAARQEIEKLGLLFPNSTVDIDQITDTVADSSRFDVFALSEAILSGNAERSLHMLNVLRQEGTEAAVVLWALTREIRSLLSIQRGLNSGRNFDQLCKQERIWGKRRNLIQNACRRLSKHLLEQQLAESFNVDQAVKGQTTDNPWVLMSQITVKLSGITINC